jgi:5-formyltetrahydrofolate cyclo-ligase
MLERRNGLATDDVEKMSRLVQEHVIGSKEFASARTVGAYYAAGSEVRTSLVIEAAKRAGKKVALPRIEGDHMVFYEYTGELAEGRFGIKEPVPRSAAVNDDIDLVLVPGLAFDRKGCRIGYGKGYYDRFLSMRHSFSMGLAYSFQVVDELPRGRFDRRILSVATEEGVLYIS